MSRTPFMSTYAHTVRCNSVISDIKRRLNPGLMCEVHGVLFFQAVKKYDLYGCSSSDTDESLMSAATAEFSRVYSYMKPDEDHRDPSKIVSDIIEGRGGYRDFNSAVVHVFLADEYGKLEKAVGPYVNPIDILKRKLQ